MRKLTLALFLSALLFTGIAYFAVHYQQPVRTISSVDDSQTLLVFYQVPERLVVLDAASGRLLQRLGIGDRVVAVSSEAAASYSEAEDLGDVAEIAPLSVVALRPDLVLCSSQSAKLAEVLRHGGVNVWLTAPSDMQSLLSGITRLGKLLGAEEQATDLTDELAADLTDLEKITASMKKMRVLVLNEQLVAAGPGTLENDLLILAGVLNELTVQGYSVLSPGQVAMAAPDVILCPQPLLHQLSMLFAAKLQGGGENVPVIVVLPEGFFQITWENILDRAEWLKQQLVDATHAGALSDNGD